MTQTIDLTVEPNQVIDIEVDTPEAVELEVVVAAPPGPKGEDSTVPGPIGPEGPVGPPGTTQWSVIENVPTEFPPSAHTHLTSEIVGLSAVINTAVGNGDATTLAQAKAYADAINVNLTSLIALAEESADIAELATQIQALAAAPPEVTQAELDAEASARLVGDANTLSSASADATSKVSAETTARTNADALKVDKDSTFGAVTKAQAILTGGGKLAVTGAYGINWSTRFLAIGSGRGTHFSTNGFFDIIMPPNGTVVPGTGGASNVTVAGNVIPLSSAYVSLYYIPPIGGTSGVQNGNYRLVGFTGDIVIPDHWILIARRNDEAGLVHWGNGSRVPTGHTVDVSGKVPTYSEVPTMRGIPGCLFYLTESAGIVTAFNYYLPFATDEPVTMTEMRCEVTGASVAGGRASFAVYTADKAGQPVTLVADFGEVAVDTVGVKVVVLGTSVFMPPGRYVILQRASANCSMRRLGYGNEKFQNISNALGGTPGRINTYVAAAYTATAPTSAPQWNASNSAADCTWRTYCVFGYTVAA